MSFSETTTLDDELFVRGRGGGLEVVVQVSLLSCGQVAKATVLTSPNTSNHVVSDEVFSVS
jgi:hypothetical protein